MLSSFSSITSHRSLHQCIATTVFSLFFLHGCASGAMPSPDAANGESDAGMTNDSAMVTDVVQSPDVMPTVDVVISDTNGDAASTANRPVHFILFTHIEDNLPGGMIGTPMARMVYEQWRRNLLNMAALAQRYSIVWVLQPDWKFLEAARAYEDATTMASTGGLNLFQFLRQMHRVVIDPHSHENGGYNYADVAYLLEQLQVGGSTVIGGHIWDPALPQFMHWERFRMPITGERYPMARWRGDILMGAGTPNHVNDPVLTGVWRPRDPSNFFTDDPNGNIVSIGGYHHDIAGITMLRELARSGRITADCMLTSDFHATPTMISNPTNLAMLERDVLAPLQQMQQRGEVVTTNFTEAVSTWRTRYGARACIYRE